MSGSGKGVTAAAISELHRRRLICPEIIEAGHHRSRQGQRQPHGDPLGTVGCDDGHGRAGLKPIRRETGGKAPGAVEKLGICHGFHAGPADADHGRARAARRQGPEQGIEGPIRVHGSRPSLRSRV